MDKIFQAAKNVLVSCMGVKEGEVVLVVVDTPQVDLGRAFYEQAVDLGAEAQLIQYLPRGNNGVEPPPAVAAAMAASQVVIMPTSTSLSHTQARKEANNQGARVASLPGLTKEMMERTLLGDYGEIARRSKTVAALLDDGEIVEITAPGGTDLTMSIKGRSGIADTGELAAKGSFGNLPAGEAYVAPVEGTASGKIVIDGAMAGIGKVSDAITIVVANGLAVDFQGGKEALKLKQMLEQHGEEGRNIAELGIGTNDLAKLTGQVLEDEKVLGTIHIAVGDNHTFGGEVTVPVHLDGMVLSPTVKIDGKVVLDRGKLA
ncbi:aminopeptidase [Metallumcola ferriviriculae]|uniref:Aminopeptidase n=1 Tax=Metallumcola ferriviriculae TaxID=3039180 RepID=A0AAU0UMB0_9FIRM|nr:aminopeptidase [Desulfitibacteraceae bacterium MK1]